METAAKEKELTQYCNLCCTKHPIEEFGWEHEEAGKRYPWCKESRKVYNARGVLHLKGVEGVREYIKVRGLTEAVRAVPRKNRQSNANEQSTTKKRRKKSSSKHIYLYAEIDRFGYKYSGAVKVGRSKDDQTKNDTRGKALKGSSGQNHFDYNLIAQLETKENIVKAEHFFLDTFGGPFKRVAEFFKVATQEEAVQFFQETAQKFKEYCKENQK